MEGIAEKEEQGPRAMKDKTELGSHMFAGEGPHALVVLSRSMKVRLTIKQLCIDQSSYISCSEVFKLGKLYIY